MWMQSDMSSLSEAQQLELIRALIEHNRPRRHLFDGLWYSKGRLSIRRHAYGEIEYLSWERAKELLTIPQPKPVLKSERITQKRKRA